MSIVGRGLGLGPHGSILVTAGYGLKAIFVPPFVGGVRPYRVPRELIDAQRRREIEADDILLLIAGSVAAGLLH